VALGDALGQFAAELGIAPRLREYEAVIRWPSIVGERIARVSKPLRVEKGVLVVNVESAPWRSELTLRRREILEKVNSTLGGPVIREIRFR
jgi:predicted nucleic acid-binding Zn ribbon protein